MINRNAPIIYPDYRSICMSRSPACAGEGCGPSVCGVDFETPPVIKLQLSLSASHSDSPSISAALCQCLFETVSGKVQSRRCDLWEHCLPCAPFAAQIPLLAFILSHFKHSHSAEWARGGLGSHRCYMSRSLVEIASVLSKLKNAQAQPLRSRGSIPVGAQLLLLCSWKAFLSRFSPRCDGLANPDLSCWIVYIPGNTEQPASC